MVKSTYSSCKGLEYLYGGLQTALTTVPRDLTPSSELFRDCAHACCTYIHTYIHTIHTGKLNIHTHKIYLKKILKTFKVGVVPQF